MTPCKVLRCIKEEQERSQLPHQGPIQTDLNPEVGPELEERERVLVSQGITGDGQNYQQESGLKLPGSQSVGEMRTQSLGKEVYIAVTCCDCCRKGSLT